jgi:hypothetical protein
VRADHYMSRVRVGVILKRSGHVFSSIELRRSCFDPQFVEINIPTYSVGIVSVKSVVVIDSSRFESGSLESQPVMSSTA